MNRIHPRHFKQAVIGALYNKCDYLFLKSDAAWKAGNVPDANHFDARLLECKEILQLIKDLGEKHKENRYERNDKGRVQEKG